MTIKLVQSYMSAGIRQIDLTAVSKFLLQFSRLDLLLVASVHKELIMLVRAMKYSHWLDLDHVCTPEGRCHNGKSLLEEEMDGDEAANILSPLRGLG